MKRSFFLTSLSLLAMSILSAQVIQSEGQGFLEDLQDQRVLHVKGSPYEMGFQHGKLLKDLILKNVGEFIDNGGNRDQEKTVAFAKQLPHMMKYVPERLIQEMKGIADGSGVALSKIIALNCFPEMFHCSGVTVEGEATCDGELYHARVLDYAVGKSLQHSAVLLIGEPEQGHRFVNVTYAGFIGSVTGMNDQHIAIGEIGGGGYGHWNGMPMAFLMREVLEKAATLDEAKNILSKTPRTCEYYYVISDGKTRESTGVYATENQIHFMAPGTAYALLSPSEFLPHYGNREDKFCTTECTLQTGPYQTLVLDQKKQVFSLYHAQLPHTITMTGFSHPERYPILVKRIHDAYGHIDAQMMQEIIQCPVARDSNLHNAIFLPERLELWVAHAGPHDEPACTQPYTHFKLSELLSY